MAESVNLDEIFSQLIALRTRLETAESRTLTLEELIQERAAQLAQTTSRLISGMGLKLRKGAQLQDAVTEAIRVYGSFQDDHTAAMEKLQMDIRELKSTIEILQADRNSVIDKLVAALELKRNPNRTLDNAAAEAIVAINEAKRIIRENL